MPNQQPNKKRIARVEVDRDLCIGAATCVALAPHTFELDSENKSVPKTPDGSIPQDHADDDEALLAAAEGCPVKAIKVFDEGGNQVYP